MRLIGNIIWLLLIGLWSAIGYALLGLILCITIIGIPFGLQCFKLAELVLTPFGKTADTNFSAHPIANVIWLIFYGLWAAIGNALAGVIFCITVIGIPFGLQCFKLAKLVLTPFGATIKS